MRKSINVVCTSAFFSDVPRCTISLKVSYMEAIDYEYSIHESVIL